MKNIFFTSDTHFGHQKMLTYYPERKERAEKWALDNNRTEQSLIDAHDQWLIDNWNKKISRVDTVYILGDFSFRTKEETENILKQLNGQKFLIRGNHDEPLSGLENYFAWVGAMKEIKIGKDIVEGIKNPINCVLCHYPLLTWRTRSRGGLMIHGHCHGGLDEYNAKSGELRFDVGIDGKLSSFNVVSVMDIYNAAMERTGGLDFFSYMQDRISTNETFKC